MYERVLIVDDEASIRQFLTIMLKRESYHVYSAKDGEEALEMAKKGTYDLILSDLKMPKVDGLQLLDQVKIISPSTVFIMMTAHGTTDTAVEAMKKGAFEYVLKPFQLDEVKLVIKRGLESQKLQDENINLKKNLNQTYSFQSIIGVSTAMLEVFKLIEKVALINSNILITGETGTGKELVARAIHYGGILKDQPFVTVNCGAIPENLLESEMFGHKKGSFTGAISDKKGLFEVANHGTLFLDEVGELPLHMQVKLLRAIQERVIRRVGDISDVKIDVRIISATNKNLEKAAKTGEFREDLYYRLNVINIYLPSLNERRDDIPYLAEHFLKKYNKLLNKDIKKISKEAMMLLSERKYQGNVRELENIIERAVALESADVLLPENISIRPAYEGVESMGHLEGGLTEGFNLEAYVNSIEKDLILKALKKANGVKKDAAVMLGITFRSFRYRLEKLNIE